MPKYTVNFKVSGGNIGADTGLLAADSVDYAEANFSFDSSWEGLYKTAVFRFLEKVYHVVLEGDCCKFPQEVLQNGVCYVSVFGVLGSVRATTPEYGIQVQKSGYVKLEPQAPTADPYNYFLESVTAEKQAAVAAAFEAEKSKMAAVQAKEDAGAAEESVIEHETAAFLNAQSAAESAALAENYKNSVAQLKDEAANHSLLAEQAQQNAETAYENILKKERIKSWTEPSINFLNVDELAEKAGIYYAENAVQLLFPKSTLSMPAYTYHYIPAQCYFSIDSSAKTYSVSVTVTLHGASFSHSNTENIIYQTGSYEYGNIIQMKKAKSGQIWLHSCCLTQTATEYDIESLETSLERALKSETERTAESARETSNNLYANALKGSLSGEALRIDDSVPFEHKVELKLKSKNLIPYPFRYTSSTSSGVTFQANADGSVTANGTSTGFANFNLQTVTLKKGNSYYLSGNAAGASQSARNWLVYFTGSTASGQKVAFEDWGKAAGYKAKEDVTGDIVLVVYEGNTANNLVFKPQMEVGEKATEYTPYVKSFSNVRVRKFGKNLIPYPYPYGSTTNNGITFTDNGDGTVTANGTATDDAFYFYTSGQGHTVSKGTYTLNGCPKGGSDSTYCQVFGATQFVDNGEGVTRIYEQEASQNFYIKIASGYTANNLIFSPQLEMGRPATYKPQEAGTVDGITSIYPVATFKTDNAGVIIDCEYNRDINKAFAALEEKLKTAISAK